MEAKINSRPALLPAVLFALLAGLFAGTAVMLIVASYYKRSFDAGIMLVIAIFIGLAITLFRAIRHDRIAVYNDRLDVYSGRGERKMTIRFDELVGWRTNRDVRSLYLNEQLLIYTAKQSYRIDSARYANYRELHEALTYGRPPGAEPPEDDPD